MMGQIQAWIEGTLAPVDVMDAHREGIRHRAVSIFVMDGEKLLLQKRSENCLQSPGLWSNTCCSHPDWGERPETCALRRLREELGIEGLYPAHADRIEYRMDVGDGLIEHEVTDIYIAYAQRGLSVNPDPELVSETRWIGLYDLGAEVRRYPDRFSRWLRFYMQEHISRILPALIC
ncbi:isopentenyl-diphosphate Delta-isomerase [Thioclava electrotropha]|nr:NUDIX domain-containing protein [Thioclava electrotropha]